MTETQQIAPRPSPLAPGLIWTENALGPAEASAATAQADSFLCRDGRKFCRRSSVARYGYDYAEKAIWLRDIPRVFDDLAQRLDVRCNSVSLALYEARDQIDPHTDLPCWEDIAILNLGATCNVTFESPSGDQRAPVHMAAGDLLKLTGDSLRTWKHSAFATRKRYSIVFRYRSDA